MYLRNRQSGHTSIELGISLVLLILISAFALDISALVYAGNFCDSACRDAARAAGDKNNPQAALDAANACLKLHKPDGFVITDISLSRFYYYDYGMWDSPLSAPTIPNPSTGSPGPYVTVTTTATVRIPVPISAWDFRPIKGTITETSQYTFPIVNTYIPVEVDPRISGTTGGGSSSSGSTSTTSSSSGGGDVTGSTMTITSGGGGHGTSTGGSSNTGDTTGGSTSTSTTSSTTGNMSGGGGSTGFSSNSGDDGG